MDRLDQIEVFVAVAEQGSFVGAARRLGRSPTAITRSVSVLEDRLGVRLLNRTTRAVSVTDAGERYLQQSRRLLSDFSELENEIQGDVDIARGALTITAPVVFGRLHVLPIVSQFLERHPKLTVNLLLLDRVVSYVDEGVDVGFRIGDLPDSSLVATRVGSVRRVLVASPDYLARHGAPVCLDDLVAHSSIVMTGSSLTAATWNFGSGAGARTIDVRPRLTVNSIDATVEAVRAGLGIARLMSYQTAKSQRNGEVVELFKELEPTPLPIHILRPAGRHMALKIRLFIDMASTTLRASLF